MCPPTWDKSCLSFDWFCCKDTSFKKKNETYGAAGPRPTWWERSNLRVAAYTIQSDSCTCSQYQEMVWDSVTHFNSSRTILTPMKTSCSRQRTLPTESRTPGDLDRRCQFYEGVSRTNESLCTHEKRHRLDPHRRFGFGRLALFLLFSHSDLCKPHQLALHTVKFLSSTLLQDAFFQSSVAHVQGCCNNDHQRRSDHIDLDHGFVCLGLLYRARSPPSCLSLLSRKVCQCRACQWLNPRSTQCGTNLSPRSRRRRRTRSGTYGDVGDDDDIDLFARRRRRIPSRFGVKDYGSSAELRQWLLERRTLPTRNLGTCFFLETTRVLSICRDFGLCHDRLKFKSIQFKATNTYCLLEQV